jgi:ABC-type nitrate/sulfonate/bicarbonate transport system permease component
VTPDGLLADVPAKSHFASDSFLSAGKRLFRRYWLIVALLIIWELVAGSGYLPRSVLPQPTSVAKTAIALTAHRDPALGSLPDHVLRSLARQLVGFGLAVAFAFPLGLWLGVSRNARDSLLPLIQALYPVPGLAWTPLAILWLGLGGRTVIFLIFIGAIWPILYGTIGGVQNIRPQYSRAAESLGATRFFHLTRVSIPAALSMMLTGLRLGYGASWRTIVGAEMIASTSGLGYMLSVAADTRRGDVIIAGMIIIGALGFLIEYFAFDRLDRATVGRWGMRESS